MNFVHWLSSFRYPDRTTATLLDQMDHPFGYTFRPANETTYKLSATGLWFGSKTSFILKTEISHPFIYLCIRMCERGLTCPSNTTHLNWDFIWLLTGDLAKHRTVHKLMSWPSSSAQLTANVSSNTFNWFDLLYLVGRGFLNNLTRRNLRSFSVY